MALHHDGHHELLFTVCYDGWLRVYSSVDQQLRVQWENDNNCLFTCLAYDRQHGQVGKTVGSLGGLTAVSCMMG